jgi:ubiquinone biosynthesis protein COQ9
MGLVYDDGGMAGTLAALDRRLRQGERTLGFLDDMAQSATRTVGQFQSFADRLGDILRGARTPSGTEGEAPPPAAPPENGPAAQT